MSVPERVILLFALFNALVSMDALGQPSALSKGEWHKIGIVDRGVYRLDYDYLVSHNIPVQSIDPATLQLFGNGGNGSLPQPNDATRSVDLIENAILVKDGGEGTFDPGDYILFFGNTSDKLEFDGEKFIYEDNIYSDTVFYFLTYNQGQGKRVQKVDPIANPSITSKTVYTSAIHDINEFNLLNSGRLWFGENFDKPGRSKKISFSLPERAQNVVLDVTVMASSLSTSAFDIAIDGENVGTIDVASRISVESVTRAFVESKSFKTAVSGGGFEVSFNYRGEDKKGFGFIDHIVASIETVLAYESRPFFFSLTTAGSVVKFPIGNFQSGLTLWDVTETDVEEVEIASDGSFSVAANTKKDFVIFEAESTVHPASFRPISNQNLRMMSGIDFLIVTHPMFKNEAKRLAGHRSAFSGFSSEVVTVDKIYNEFSSGAQDVTAIRDFIRHLFSSGNLKHVLLFGDGSYDYKDRVISNTNFVPTYQSRNSLNEIFSYSSDDFYSFMEEHEGEWEENNSSDHSMDVSIGRLPAKSKEQAAIIVDKIIHYDTQGDFGPWRTKILFAADDGDDNLHHRDADLLAREMDKAQPRVAVNKLYLDAFPQKDQYSAEASAAFERQLHEGVLVVDYSGHGNELQLTAERLVTDIDINAWTNKNVLPFFVTSTCEFGVFDNPDWYSSGERLLFHKDGGGIGLISATRLVYSNSNFLVNDAFTSEIFSWQNGEYQTIGEIFKNLKNKSLYGRSNRNYTLLGDPSMMLSYPKLDIKVDSILDHSNNPVERFQSFFEVTIFGSVRGKNQQVSSSFHGETEMVFYDHPKDKVTLGEQNEPFSYQDRSSILFSGKATVDSGLFQMKVLLPKGISEFTDEAKMIFYAKDLDGTVDASGGVNGLVYEVGETISDTKSPKVQVFVGDTLFQSNNSVSSNTDLLVFIADESGVDLSHNDPSKILRAELNGVEIVLNEYYQSDLDTYKSGQVVYSFRNLKEGDYHLAVLVSDVAGNQTVEEVDFKVVKTSRLAINDFKVFPNPSVGDVRFSFKHDRTNEDLRIDFKIINISGSTVYEKSFSIIGAPGIVDTIEWTKIEQETRGIDAGIYIYDFIVSSEKDGASNRLKGRLILH